MREKIVAGNWKMNLDYASAMALTDTILQQSDDSWKTKIILAPPFPYLVQVKIQLRTRTNIFLAAQNCSDHKDGAYTGEISAAMLKSIGVDYVIIGHSERRKFYRESNDLLAQKIDRAFENELLPIYCCGETAEQRKEGRQFETVKEQLTNGLFHLSARNMNTIVIAYEPVWAIGTGVNATPDQAEEMHRYIRTLLNDKYNEGIAEGTRILYGGSVTSQNASELFSRSDIDGGLVGGASLKAGEFCSIIKAMESAS
jgi:triosephosphate isomerase